MCNCGSRHEISSRRIMWIGQGKYTMPGDFRFVQQILTFRAYSYCGLVCLIEMRVDL